MTFLKKLKRIQRTGQARSVVLTGNINDLFPVGDDYAPLIDCLSHHCQLKPTQKTKGITQLIYRLNNPIIVKGDSEELKKVWGSVTGSERSLEEQFKQSNRNATFALELLRQLTECFRRYKGRENNLIIIIEAADLLIPNSEISRMSLADRQRVAIVHDWFSDPAFLNSGDTVILISESRSNIHHRIAQLPQVISVDVPLPNLEERAAYIKYRSLVESVEVMAEQTAGLSIHAMRQLLLSGNYTATHIAAKVEAYMIGQLGEGVIEFKRPSHTLEDVIGFSRIKSFMQNTLIPGFLDGSIGGAAVGGPIGGGKTFICEAVAAELGIPVILLKGIRSKWFGETDKIFERLRRLLESFHRIVIFVDEADTQFGAVEGGHETERRLTGKIQAMMSDVQLRGKVIWFLMTARIHLLSPDIRRPGRMDLIIPILDPEGTDREEFMKWCFSGLGSEAVSDKRLVEVTRGYSAAAFATLRAQTKTCSSIEEAVNVAEDMVLPDIEITRHYQKLQAMVNCTRRSLVNFQGTRQEYDTRRKSWRQEIGRLEDMGIH